MSDAIALQQVSDLLSGDTAAEEPLDVVDQVADLLSAPEGATAEEPTGDSETEEQAPEPEAASGVDYAQEIPMTDGSKVPLGELKDHYQSYQAKLGELITRENEAIKQQSEVNDLLGYVQNLPKELVQQIQERQRFYMETEHHRMLEAIPEFKDAGQFKVARDGIYALASEYGVQDVIENVTDHRVIKMLHDFARLKQGIGAAKAAVKPIRAATPKSATPKAATTTEAAMAKAKETGQRNDQVTAVSKLLGFN